MKRRFSIAVIGLFFTLSLFMVHGCAQKAVVKEEAVVKEQPVQEVVAKPAQPAEQAKPPVEAAVKQPAAAPVAAIEKPAVKKEVSFPDIHFDFDKFNLKPEAREILKKVADALTADKSLQILIEGHCDDRGTNEYNLALGERRANEAMKYLVDLGIDAKRIKTISYGEERPLDTAQNEEAWAKNRRAHFVFTAK